jgi:hypothetical protein
MQSRDQTAQLLSGRSAASYPGGKSSELRWPEPRQDQQRPCFCRAVYSSEDSFFGALLWVVPGTGPAIRLLCDMAKLLIGVGGRGTGSSCSTASGLRSGRRLSWFPSSGASVATRVEVAPFIEGVSCESTVQARNRDVFP